MRDLRIVARDARSRLTPHWGIRPLPTPRDPRAGAVAAAPPWRAWRRADLTPITPTLVVVLLVATPALRQHFRGRNAVRASTLLPYVAPVGAATSVWSTTPNPQFGIVDHRGTRLLGWEGPVAFLTTTLMAGAVVPTLPIIVLFFAGERPLTGGLTAGAEKG